MISRFSRRNDLRARNHPAYWAFLMHRVSGLLLASFLPVHFLVLGKALEAEASLDSFLLWTEQPYFKAAEIVLVVLLTAHLTGGLRLLVIEGMPWGGTRKNLIAAVAGVSMATGLLFALAILC